MEAHTGARGPGTPAEVSSSFLEPWLSQPLPCLPHQLWDAPDSPLLSLERTREGPREAKDPIGPRL